MTFHQNIKWTPFQPSLEEYPKTGETIDNLYLKTDAGVLNIIKEVKPVGEFEITKSRLLRVTVFGHECLAQDRLRKAECVFREKRDHNFFKLWTRNDILELHSLNSHNQY